jgi:hypothetical protein
VAARYAVAVGDVDPYALADAVLVPLRVVYAGDGEASHDSAPDLPATGSLLTIGGAEVSAVVRDTGTLTVRVVNPMDETTTVTIDGRRGWLVDLRGRPLEPFEGSFELRPYGIATAALTS